MFFLPDFGLRLKAERKRLGVTQDEMAHMLGVTRNVVVSYEAGRTSPTVGSLYTAASHGLDPVFVIAGMSSKAFVSDDEQKLLDYYNRLDVSKRESALGILAVLADDVAGFQQMMSLTPSLSTLQSPRSKFRPKPVDD